MLPVIDKAAVLLIFCLCLHLKLNPGGRHGQFHTHKTSYKMNQFMMNNEIRFVTQNDYLVSSSIQRKNLHKGLVIIGWVDLFSFKCSNHRLWYSRKLNL